MVQGASPSETDSKYHVQNRFLCDGAVGHIDVIMDGSKPGASNGCQIRELGHVVVDNSRWSWPACHLHLIAYAEVREDANIKLAVNGDVFATKHIPNMCNVESESRRMSKLWCGDMC